MAEEADVIFFMDATQTDRLAKLGFLDKAELLDPDDEEIPDPRGQDMAFFRQVRDRIGDALERRAPQIIADADRC